MKKRHHIICSAVISLAALMISGCLKEEFREPAVGDESGYIRFTAAHKALTRSHEGNSTRDGFLSVMEEDMDTASGPFTRADQVSELDGLKASVSAFLTGGPSDWNFVNRNFVFDYEDLNPESEEDMISWGSVGEATAMTVYAFSPRPAEGSALTIGSDGNPTYTASLSDPSGHIDIIAAGGIVQKNAFGHTIPLEFSHILTGVRFKMGFECHVKSLTLTKVNTTAEFNPARINEPTVSDPQSYTLNIGSNKRIGDFLNYGEDTYMMVPQTLSGSEVILVYSDTAEGEEKTIKASLDGHRWVSGKLMTYTINETYTPDRTIEFDLAAGNVTIDDKNYTGYIFSSGLPEAVTGLHAVGNMYHVYQSATTNRKAEGKTGRPAYARVKNGTWGEFITNNTNVEDVIHTWDNEAGAKAETEPAAGASGEVRKVGREGTKNTITISGSSSFHLTVDNIYTTYQEHSTGRNTGGIAYLPSDGNSSLVIYLEGDNRVGCVHYAGHHKGNSLTFENCLTGSNGNIPGTLTAADTDYITVNGSAGDHGGAGYYGNHWNTAIGHNDGTSTVYGLSINSGVIFAGTTAAENCTAIGAGGNGYGEVIINGGTVTAVATTTGTAIGGGIGFHSQGGEGEVRIAGGTVYAYNHANKWDIPSSAIGGAGSLEKYGAKGTVTITHGTVYAESALGTAIGGGSSYSSYGGEAIVTITGGDITAKSGAGAGIGGGTGCSCGIKGEYKNTTFDGGNATIDISGHPVIRTGSIGGGKTGAAGAYLGKADITVSGGDIQAQFIMEATGAGAENRPTFTMSGGTIRENDPINNDGYYYVKEIGGAVYMNEGTFTMTGGTIKDCSAVQGGAVYINGNENPTFTMTGGTIKSCSAIQGGSDPSLSPDGGGVYLANGTVNISGSAEIRECRASNGGGIYLNGGTVSISGGKIYDNLVTGGNGGGICIIGGDFTMSGNGSTTEIIHNTAISDNNAGGSGGGLYVTSTADNTSEVTVKLLNGNVYGNSADRLGGGICVDMDDSKSINTAANVIVGTSGAHVADPGITENKALIQGGGLYVIGSKAKVTIENGLIMGNTTMGYVYNENVANEKGIVALNDKDVTTSVTVTFDSNDDSAIIGRNQNDAGRTFTQYIVTSTNSLLAEPEYKNFTGKTFRYWHTRPDGDDSKGRRYADGDIMNLTEDITLYAQWQ